MAWLLYYTAIQYYKQKFHIWGIAIVVLLWLIVFVVSSLSPIDTTKIFIENILGSGELLGLFFVLLYAIHASNQVSCTQASVIKTWGVSYMKIYATYWLLGVCILFVGLMVLSVMSLVYGGLYGGAMYGHILLLYVYMFIKLLLIYTIVYTIAYHIKKSFAFVFGGVLYLLFYTIPFRKIALHNINNFLLQGVLQTVVFISPMFVSVVLSEQHRDRLATNIFTIVISGGIYIVCIFLIGIWSYSRIVWK